MNPGPIPAARACWHAAARQIDLANSPMERTQGDSIRNPRPRSVDDSVAPQFACREG